eukprot:TRINITY_DN34138_c1_g4_i3.p1 TRINITY_DN34138_c1_g4~~TRINITY_DN34138_c1_g4_i3.p1  ORF type:complete len:445 (+),score=97.18 TRINITY_DN34138_c1_g4_i3:152-1486(+)
MLRAMGGKTSLASWLRRRGDRRRSKIDRAFEMIRESCLWDRCGDIESRPQGPRRLQVEGLHGAAAAAGGSGMSFFKPSSSREYEYIGAGAKQVSRHEEDLLTYYDSQVERLKKNKGDDDHAPVAGDLYTYMALRGFGESSGLFQVRSDILLLLGLFLIIVVQLLAPLTILIWSAYRIDWFPDGAWVTSEKFQYVPGSDEKGITYIGQNILGAVFIVLFNLNGTYVMRSHHTRMQRLLDMTELFQVVAARNPDHFQVPRTYWLWVGAYVNCICLIFCALSLPPLLILVEEGPKGVVFDALGLTFLYNLDDVAGDLGFLDDKWDDNTFGDIYGGLADQIASGHGELLTQKMRSERETSGTPDKLFTCGYFVMMVLVIVAPLGFLFGNFLPVGNVEASSGPSSSHGDLHRMQEDIANLQAASHYAASHYTADLRPPASSSSLCLATG